VPESTALVDQLVDLGLVERLGDGRLRVHDPALLVSGLQVVELGVPPERLISAQAQVNEHVRAVARSYVQLIVDTAWRDLVGAGAPLDAVRDLGARLQPVAAQAVLAAFRTEMAAAVQEAVERELSRLADPR
jgi:hypothetical protein